MTNTIKPVIRKYRDGWVCETWFISGFGKTPKSAYKQWLNHWRGHPSTGAQFSWFS